MPVRLWRTALAWCHGYAATSVEGPAVAGARAGCALGGQQAGGGTEEVAGARAGSAEGGKEGDLGGRATRKRMKLNTQVTVADRFRTAKRCTTQHGRAGTPARKHEV